MDEQLTENRRTKARAPMNAELQCVVDGEVRVISAADVSEGGVKISGIGVIADPFRPIKLYLPIRRPGSGKPHLCLAEGMVAWKKDDEAGIVFNEPAPETVSEISAYVNGIE